MGGGVSSNREQEGSQVCNGVERQSSMLGKALAIVGNRSMLAYAKATDTWIYEFSRGRYIAFSGLSKSSKIVEK